MKKSKVVKRIILMCVLLCSEVLLNTYFNVYLKNCIFANEDSSINVSEQKLVHSQLYTVPLVTTENIVTYNNFMSEDQINLLCQVVQHEVGHDENYFPGYDFDYI